jgi:hypothetical protein
MPEYKTTYTFVAEYLETNEAGARRTEPVEIPLVSSDKFFELMDTPEIKALSERGLSADEGLAFGRWLTEQIVPGLAAKLSPPSAMSLIKTIFEHEKDTFGLGGTTQPTAQTPDSTPAS